MGVVKMKMSYGPYNEALEGIVPQQHKVRHGVLFGPAEDLGIKRGSR